MPPLPATPSSNRSGNGLSRAALSRKEIAPASQDEGVDAVRRANYRAAAGRRPRGWGLRDVLHVFGGVLLGVPLLLALLLGLRKIGDGLSAAAYLSEAKSLRSDLICQNGEIVRGDGSWSDLVLSEPVFICTEWRTLQGQEAEEAALKR